jgi:hypothetical protein
MAFETKTIIGNKKTIMVYQTTDTIAVCSANDYFTENLVGQPIIILNENTQTLPTFFSRIFNIIFSDK